MNTATNTTVTTTNKPWIVDSAECGWNGGLQVVGRNTNYPAEHMDHKFVWSINHHGLASDDFDFSACVFGPRAKERLTSLLALAEI